MKKRFVLFCLLFSLAQSVCFAANQPLVGREAPAFTAKAVVNGTITDFSMQNLKGKYTVLFFYPLDFTFVCPTELHAFQERIADFEAKNAQVVACSVDSVYTHLAWWNTPRKIGGIAGVQYPLISDLDKSISRNYGVLDEGSGISYRGLFLIDREGIVRHLLINDLPLGRNVDEALRMLDALATYEQFGEVCPANWKAGNKTLKRSAEGLIEFFAE